MAQTRQPVLVTGATGNVGAAVVQTLLAAGLSVRAAAGSLSWETDERALLDAYLALQVSPAQAGILGRHTHRTKEGS